MRVTDAVEAKARHEPPVDEAALTAVFLVALAPVTADRQNFLRYALNRHDIRQRQPLVVFVEIEIGVDLVDLIFFCRIDTRSHALRFVGGFLDLIAVHIQHRLVQFDLTIDAGQHERLHLTLRHRLDAGITRAGFQIDRAVWNDNLIRRLKPRDRALQDRVLIRLRERAAHERQPHHHLVFFFDIFRRKPRQVQVHPVLHARRLRFQIRVRHTRDLRFHRSCRRKQFCHCR